MRRINNVRDWLMVNVTSLPSALLQLQQVDLMGITIKSMAEIEKEVSPVAGA